MQGIISIKASGRIRVYSMIDNKKKLLLTRHNSIDPNATDIVARSLGNFDISKVDTIKAYLSSSLLGTATISTYLHPDVDQVSYTATFSAGSFDGIIDELRLEASAMGLFALATGLNIDKGVGTALVVNWTITISICSS